MPKHDPMEALKKDPAAAALLGDPAALAALLQSKEAKTLAEMFQRVGGDQLRQAAQAAAGGDGAALSAIVDKVRSDPAGAKAMEAIDRKSGK